MLVLSDAAHCIAGEGRSSERDIEPIEALKRDVAARLACHSSIRGKSEAPDSARIAAILNDLKSCDDPDRCPHGRPTRINISATELKKMFKK
jgi:DNA mismatch repair protein MutL